MARVIAERAAEAARELSVGLAGGWLLGLGVAIPVGRFRRAWVYDAASTLTTGLLLSLPTALLAYLWLMAGFQAGLVLVVVLPPSIFPSAPNLLAQEHDPAPVETARARGASDT